MDPVKISSSSADLSSAGNSGLAGVSAGNRALDQEAQQIADPNTPDVTASVLNTSQSLHIAQAGADVISTSNEVLGTLLNTFA